MELINGGRPFRSRDAADFFGSRKEFKEAISQGLIRWVVRSVAVDSAIPDSRSVRAQAARLVVPTHAIASDDYAAFIYGADTQRPGRRWEKRPMYMVTHSSYISRPGYAIVRQSKGIPDEDVLEIDGLLLTTPVRTASDLLRLHYRPHALAAGDAMTRAGLIVPGAVAEHLSRLHRVPGLPQARELVHRLTPDAESHGESWLRCRILDAGFPCPTIQYRIRDALGIVRRFDLAYEEVRVAAEYDGREHHTADEDQELDGSRRNDFRLRLGWRFLIAVYESVFGHDTSYEEQLGELIGVEPRPRTWY